MPQYISQSTQKLFIVISNVLVRFLFNFIGIVSIPEARSPLTSRTSKRIVLAKTRINMKLKTRTIFSRLVCCVESGKREQNVAQLQATKRLLKPTISLSLGSEGKNLMPYNNPETTGIKAIKRAKILTNKLIKKPTSIVTSDG